ncbi:MAG: hypothetical protein J5871_03080 [Bacteroidales bacterium]|nr:hypothetical protein [Bacteroidales bacterium]
MKLFRHIALLAVALCTWTSCSLVLEDRTSCPCWLNMTVDPADGPGVLRLPARLRLPSQAMVAVWDKDEYVLQAHAEPFPLGQIDTLRHYLMPAFYECEVRKGMLDVCCIHGMEKSVQEGRRLLIPAGEQADTLWTHCHLGLDCTGEFAFDTVRLHKQFAHVKLRIQLTRRDMEMGYPLYPLIRSNVCGMDMTDPKTPLTGAFGPADASDGAYDSAFAYAPALSGWDETKDGRVFAVYCFRLPRHTEASEAIRIELYHESDRSYVTGVNVGGYINSQIAYDWTADDLEDFIIDWDFSRVDFDPARDIRVRDWNVIDTYIDPM